MQLLSCKRLSILVASLLLPTTAFGLGEETLGNAQLNEANYKDWPGLAAVVNDPARVYQSWVNGNENCYYTGTTAELNQTLANFAAAELKVHEVVLRPGPGSVKNFDGTSEFTVNWHLQIFGGIAAHLTTRDRGELVWPKHPRLTVYIGGDIDLANMEVPKGVKLLDIADLSARARQGTESKDQNVRGWSAGVIASIDPYDKENLAAIEKLLKDDDNWVRLNAAGAIPLFGRHAASAVPELKACLERDDKNLQERAQKAIEEIEAAVDTGVKERAHAEALAAIERFIADRTRQSKD